MMSVHLFWCLAEYKTKLYICLLCGSDFKESLKNSGSTPKLVETLFLERNRCSQIQLSCNEIDHRCIAFEGLKTSCFAFRRLNHRVDPFADRVCQARVENIQYLRPVMSQCQGSILHRLQAAAPHPWTQFVQSRLRLIHGGRGIECCGKLKL